MKIIFRSLIGILSLFLLYFLLALILSIIPVNKKYTFPAKGIEIFLSSNGVHLDFILPVNTSTINWQDKLPSTNFKSDVSRFPYIAFGWGDKAFYFETPTWQDLQFSTAFKSMFLQTPTAMHVTYKYQIPKDSTLCKKLYLTETQYQQLVNYIAASFQTDSNGDFILNPNDGYTKNDRFYEAHGSYNCIQTCNYWVNKGLKKIGIKTSVWSPFDKGVLLHLK